MFPEKPITTHYNTSWDFARFEVCMHKWMDVSENGYGVSILNDCKYGVSVHDGVIGVSMLKSATYPNPQADKEHHSFCFSIYPHRGDFREAGTIQKAYALNNPMRGIVKENHPGTLPGTYSALAVDVPNVIPEVVKEAEDGQGTVLRLYEAFNRRTRLKLHLGEGPRKAYLCNMLEENEKELRTEGNEVELELKPFEIATLRII